MTTTAKQTVVRVWGKSDWASYYGSEEKLDERIEDLMQSPCPFYPKKRVLDTHFAFMGVPDINGDPLTVAKWLDLHPADGQPKFYHNRNPWHVMQPHTDVAVLNPRLYIVLREIVPGSTSKTLVEHMAMLPPEYEVPTTIVEVTKSILVFRKTGKRCNGSRWAACSERTVRTSRVLAGDVSCVGCFGESGLIVGYWRSCCDECVGVGASRKLDFLYT